MSEFIIQGIGVAAIAFGILSLQLPKRRGILLFQMTANALWVVHFGLLSAFTGAIMNLIGVIRVAAFFHWDGERRPIGVLIGILALIIIGGLVTWQGLISLLPMVGFIVATLGLWQRDEQRIRWFMLAAVPFWISYNALSGSQAGIANETLVAISSAIALARYRRDKNKPSNALSVSFDRSV